MNTKTQENLSSIVDNLNTSKLDICGAKEKNKSSLLSFETSLLNWLKEQGELTEKEFLVSMTRFGNEFLKEIESHSSDQMAKLNTFLESIREHKPDLSQNGVEKIAAFLKELKENKESFVADSIGREMHETFLKPNVDRIALDAANSKVKLESLEESMSSSVGIVKEINELKSNLADSFQKINESISELINQFMRDSLNKVERLDEKVQKVEMHCTNNLDQFSKMKEDIKLSAQAAIETLNVGFKTRVETPFCKHLDSNLRIVDDVDHFYCC